MEFYGEVCLSLRPLRIEVFHSPLLIFLKQWHLRLMIVVDALLEIQLAKFPDGPTLYHPMKQGHLVTLNV